VRGPWQAQPSFQSCAGQFFHFIDGKPRPREGKGPGWGHTVIPCEARLAPCKALSPYLLPPFSKSQKRLGVWGTLTVGVLVS
jgi:hypothetical protein